MLELELSSGSLIGVVWVVIASVLLSVGLDLFVDVHEALLYHVVVGLWLRSALTSIAAHVHSVAIAVTSVLCLVNLSPGRWIIVLALHRRLLQHDLVLVLFVLVLEVPPLGEDFHGLNVLDRSQLLPVVLVTAEGVEVDLLAETLVLVLDYLQNIVDLLTVKHFLVVHSRDRVENGPHYLRVVHPTVVVPDVKAENDFVELRLLDSDALVA